MESSTRLVNCKGPRFTVARFEISMNCSLLMDEFQSTRNVLHDPAKSKILEFLILIVRVKKLCRPKFVSNAGMDEIVKIQYAKLHVDIIFVLREPAMLKDLDNIVVDPVFIKSINHVCFLNDILITVETSGMDQFPRKYLSFNKIFAFVIPFVLSCDTSDCLVSKRWTSYTVNLSIASQSNVSQMKNRQLKAHSTMCRIELFRAQSVNVSKI